MYIPCTSLFLIERLSSYMFIEVTDTNDFFNKTMLNINHIIRIRPSVDSTEIETTSNDGSSNKIFVSESYIDIRNKLRRAN